MTHASLSLHFTCMESSAGNLERHCLLVVFKKVHSMNASEFRNILPNIQLLFQQNALVFLLLKTSAFCWNNNCIIVNMHGKTTIKILPTSLRVLKNQKAKFKVVLRIYLNTHYFYALDDFLIGKYDYILFYKMFIIFYFEKILYICVFMASYTSYCLCLTLVDPWNACMHVYMYILIPIIFILFLIARPVVLAQCSLPRRIAAHCSFKLAALQDSRRLAHQKCAR
jgi:hypothetical protein